MKKIFLFLIVLFFPLCIVNCREIKLESKKIYSNGEAINNPIFMSDESYVMGSVSTSFEFDDSNKPIRFDTNLIYKYDKNGEVLWKKEWIFNGVNYLSNVIKVENDNLLVSGYFSVSEFEDLINKGGRDAVVMKLDSYGNIVWKNTFAGSGSDEYNKSFFLSDGSYAVVGEFSSTDIPGYSINGDIDALIIKYDKEGKLIWSKTIGGSGADSFSNIVELSDGSIVAIGSTTSADIDDVSLNGGDDILVVKYDKNGNLIWKKCYGEETSDTLGSVFLSENDELVFVGKRNNDKVLSFKIDKDGNVIWENLWGGKGNDFTGDSQLLSDGSLIIVGDTESKDIVSFRGYGTAFMIKYDKDGKLLWQKFWDGNLNEYMYGILELNNSNFITIGIYNSTDIPGLENKGENSIAILKYDKDGNLLWHDSYGGSGGEYFTISAKTKNGFMIMGTSTSFEDEGLIKGDYSNFCVLLKYAFIYDLKLNEQIINGGASVEQKENLGIIRTIPNEGYEVSEIIVKDTNGNQIDVNMIENNLYNFELYDDVSIDVIFDKSFNIVEKEIKNGKANITKIGKIVKIKPVPNTGFKLGKIIVKNTKDEIIEVVDLEDGTFSFVLNDDVTIDVVFESIIENPKTGSGGFLGVLFGILFISIIGLFNIMNKRNSMEL